MKKHEIFKGTLLEIQTPILGVILESQAKECSLK